MLMWYFETWVVFFQMWELSNFQKSVTYIKKILMDVINLWKFHLILEIVKSWGIISHWSHTGKFIFYISALIYLYYLIILVKTRTQSGKYFYVWYVCFVF